MYPRNAESPPTISIGAVVQISDGAVQTAGVSVTVKQEGGAETAGGGTLTCLGTSKIWTYTPTQAETDCTAFIVSVYKTGCLPVPVTVVTTASSTPGTVALGNCTHGGDVMRMIFNRFEIDGNFVGDGTTTGGAIFIRGNGVPAVAIRGNGSTQGRGVFDIDNMDTSAPCVAIGGNMLQPAFTMMGQMGIYSIGGLLVSGTISSSGDITFNTGTTSRSLNALCAIFSGMTNLAAWLRSFIRKSAADATAKNEINTGGGTFDETTDSLEALQGADPVAKVVPGSYPVGTLGYIIGINLDAKVSEVGGGSGVNIQTEEIIISTED